MHRRVTVVDFPCWATIEPAPDIPGKWVAHCLEFDTLAQADDPETAIALLLESTSDIVLEDLRAGEDPRKRRTPADDDGWLLLQQLGISPELLGCK